MIGSMRTVILKSRQNCGHPNPHYKLLSYGTLRKVDGQALEEKRPNELTEMPYVNVSH